MANNEEQLARLRRSIARNNGCSAWNQWRRNNSEINIDFRNAHFRSANIHGANLRDADFGNADLRNADLCDADLRGADLSGVDLRGAVLSGAYLSGTNLRNADLTYANLIGTHLRGADLMNANLYSVRLRGAHLMSANFTGTNLTGADLRDAVLTYANLSGADLRDADFSSANLTSINLSGATVGRTVFGNVDLRQIAGLASIHHEGPSTIGIDTLYQSGGAIPEAFLRGCGVPDSLIDFAQALVHAQNPIDYYSVFISYNHEDEAFATRLYNDLQMNNVRCWKYTEDMKIGDSIHTRVDEAIRFHDKLLVIFSEYALQSGWVASEVETALAREKRDNHQVLFPVTIDTAIKDIRLGWAAEVHRTRNIGDFTAWKDQDQYQLLFAHLLNCLKADSR